MTKQTRALAALAGLVSAVTGLGLAALVAGLVGGDNPAIALGSRVIDLTPGFLKDWAVRELGTKDKPVLLASIFVAMAVLAGLAGLLTLRSRTIGLGFAAALNLVALAAAVVTTSGDLRLSAATLLPGLVSLVVGVTVLAVFTSARVVGAEAARPAGFDRRAFLTVALAGTAVAATSGGVSRTLGRSGEASRRAVMLPRAASAAGRLPAGVDLPVKGLTRHLTSNQDFYRVDTALSVPQIDARTWRLRITGMVEKEVELSFQDLLEMPLVERRITLTCVSNEVGGSYVGNATWLGVRMKDLLALAGPRAGADAVRSKSVDAMTIGTPLAALTDDRDALLAIGMNGRPLPLEHGFPARMVTPGLYGYVSATKWVTELEVTRFEDFTAYWTARGWAEQAPIHTESRIDVPRQFARPEAGRIAVAGVAWSQGRGIDKVEVRDNDGAWRTARLAPEDGIDTWRQWVLEWDASPGQHVLEVRATDRSGHTQTPHRASPRPDGATGWHSVTVNVR